MKKSILVFYIVLISCSTDSNKVVDNRPVTNGIFITNETSPDHIALLGTPDTPEDSRSSADGFSFETPYPNPASGYMWMNITVPSTTVGKIWLERARFISEKEEDYINPFVEEIISQTFEKGAHSVNLSNGFKCGNDSENTLNQGFYRVYFESEEFYYWQDIYILGYFEDTPEDLRSYTIEFCRDE